MKKIFLLLFIITPLICEVAKEFQYTGMLREFGQPVTGQRNMIFNIYTQPTGGVPVWTSGEVNVQVSSGVFSYNLAPNIDLRDGNFWIEVVIGGKIFSPRQKIMPQVFALHSNTAEGLSKKGDIHFVINNTTYAVLSTQGLYIAGQLIATNAINTAAIVDGAVTTEKIQDNAVTTSKIQDGTITDADISSNAGIQLSKTSGNLPPNRISAGSLPLNVVASSIAVNSVYTAAIVDGAVTTSKIQDNAVTNSKVAGIDASKITSGVLGVNRGGTGLTSGSAGYYLRWVSSTTLGNSVIYDDGSKAGIGTTSLGVARFTVKGASSDNTSAALHLVNSTDQTILYARNDRNVSIGDSNPGTARLKIVSATSDNTSFGLVVQNTNGTTILAVRSDNRVGIGKDNPAGLLDVQGKIKEYGYDLLPRGVIVMWSGSIASIPPGWALCDGGTYTAPDGTQVTTPNLKDRFIVGAGGSYAVGATGGANTVTLTVDQIPSHTHTATCSTAGAHSHTYVHSWTFIGPDGLSGGSSAHSDNENWTTSTDGAHTHTITIGATGGGQPHENRPPYYALAFIMKL